MKRGRPPGSKNRLPGRRRLLSPYDRVMHAFSSLPYDTLDAIVKLQQDSGIEIKIVVEDLIAEGLTCCREDLYAEIIKRRANRGKVVREDGTLAGEKTQPKEQNEPERDQRDHAETETAGTSGLQRGVGLVDDPERQYAPAEDQGIPQRSDVIAMRPRLEGEDAESADSTEEEME